DTGLELLRRTRILRVDGCQPDGASRVLAHVLGDEFVGHHVPGPSGNADQDEFIDGGLFDGPLVVFGEPRAPHDAVRAHGSARLVPTVFGQVAVHVPVDQLATITRRHLLWPSSKHRPARRAGRSLSVEAIRLATRSTRDRCSAHVLETWHDLPGEELEVA